jgi:hypothetical protein
MPNYAALKVALATGGVYAGMTDAEAVTACNAPTQTVTIDVPVLNVVEYLALNGLLPTVAGWARAAPTPPASGLSAQQTQAAVTAAQVFGLMLGPPPQWPTLSMSDPTTNAQVQGLVGALVTGGLLPQANADAILAMSTQLVSQASLWGFENGVYENDLVAARAMP